jgi:hypothetical protein
LSSFKEWLLSSCAPGKTVYILLGAQCFAGDFSQDLAAGFFGACAAADQLFGARVDAQLKLGSGILGELRAVGTRA